MSPQRAVHLLLVALTIGLGQPGSSVPEGGELRDGVASIRGRVALQRLVESAYYAHQVGSVLPFEEAISEAGIEKKVRRYLKLSEALRTMWNTPVTREALEAELMRIETNTLFPSRLREVYDALGNDRGVIRETLARPILVERLARSFFAFDRRLHENAWKDAKWIRSRMLARQGSKGGAVPLIRETRGEFLVASASGAEMHYVPKRDWDEWWDSVEPELAGGFDDVDAEDRSSESYSHDLQATQIARIAADRWTNGSLDRLPEGRKRHTSVWTGAEMIIWGGTDVIQVPRHGLRYDPLTDTWNTTTSVNAPSGRISHSAVWTGTEMIVWGGGSNTGGRYDPVTDTWRPTSQLNAPSARSEHTAVWTGTEMIVWGGGSNTGGRYDPVTDTWRPTSQLNAPSARSEHTAVWTGTEMIVWGGGSNTGGRYDPVTDTWRPTSQLNAPSARSKHLAVWTADVMVIWGGLEDSNTGGRYNPSSDTWNATSVVNAPQPRNNAEGVWTGLEMIVWGGSRIGSLVADGSGGRYHPGSDTWFSISSINAPLPRMEHTAVWADNLMLVWGGASDGEEGIHVTGGRYKPDTGSWTPTSSTNDAPTPRFEHSAVWTGNLMIVWGGLHGQRVLQSGSRYDPLVDAWTPTTMIGAPSARRLHSALWTGQRMFIWGGAGRTGALYDPILDSWGPTSITNAPDGRREASAVWTGSVAVIWGGEDRGTYFGSGGRYNPATNSWEQVSMDQAPSSRRRHTAVWTGAEMMVWGGEDGVNSLDTGARYDPSQDEWTSLPSDNAPNPRFGHSGVWDGGRMIIWGGQEATSSFTNSGGAYSPLTNEWVSISSDNAPSPRSGHSTIWTGEEMIVWGGGQTFATETGGRYSPASDVWIPTTIIGGPRARFEPSAIWTGSEMIVWGGQGHFGGEHGAGILGEEATGGRYSSIAPNNPPVADAGADISVECASYEGAIVTLDGSPSTDPDGDTLSFSWTSEGIAFDDAASPTPSANFPVGTSEVVLTVFDGEYESSVSIRVTVRDTNPPNVTATLEPSVGWQCHDHDDKSPFVVVFGASDICDPTPSVSAELLLGCCGVLPIATGQNITFERDDDCEIEYEDDMLEIEAPFLGLHVSASDMSGNVATSTESLVVDTEHDHHRSLLRGIRR